MHLYYKIKFRQDGRNFLQRMEDDMRKRKMHNETAQKNKVIKLQEEIEKVEATNIHKSKYCLNFFIIGFNILNK